MRSVELEGGFQGGFFVVRDLTIFDGGTTVLFVWWWGWRVEGGGVICVCVCGRGVWLLFCCGFAEAWYVVSELGQWARMYAMQTTEQQLYQQRLKHQTLVQQAMLQQQNQHQPQQQALFHPGLLATIPQVLLTHSDPKLTNWCLDRIFSCLLRLG